MFLECRLMNFVSDFIFPNLCVGCGSPTSCKQFPVCLECEDRLETPLAGETRIVIESAYADCGLPVGVERATALWYYQPGSALPALHRAVKFHGAYRLGISLGERLGTFLAGQSAVPPVLMPVPLHAVRLRERGFNQAASIAEGVARTLGLELRSRALLRRTLSKTQVGRNRKDRFEAMRGAFVVNPDQTCTGSALLIDDVITTGATIVAATEALREGGFACVHVAAIGLAPNE